MGGDAGQRRANKRANKRAQPMANTTAKGGPRLGVAAGWTRRKLRMLIFEAAFSFDLNQSYQLIHGKQPVLPEGRRSVFFPLGWAKSGTCRHPELPIGMMAKCCPFQQISQ